MIKNDGCLIQIAFTSHRYQQELAIGVMHRDDSDFKVLTQNGEVHDQMKGG